MAAQGMASAVHCSRQRVAGRRTSPLQRATVSLPCAPRCVRSLLTRTLPAPCPPIAGLAAGAGAPAATGQAWRRGAAGCSGACAPAGYRLPQAAPAASRLAAAPLHLPGSRWVGLGGAAAADLSAVGQCTALACCSLLAARRRAGTLPIRLLPALPLPAHPPRHAEVCMLTLLTRSGTHPPPPPPVTHCLLQRCGRRPSCLVCDRRSPTAPWCPRPPTSMPRCASALVFRERVLS